MTTKFMQLSYPKLQDDRSMADGKQLLTSGKERAGFFNCKRCALMTVRASTRLIRGLYSVTALRFLQDDVTMCINIAVQFESTCLMSSPNKVRLTNMCPHKIEIGA